MNKLKRYAIAGILFVTILGTLAHFFYEWSNNNVIVGLFAPINESTWEHMKLIFFPMLLFSLIAIPRLKEEYPCITSSVLLGNIIGTALIPIMFYTYTGIIGYSVFILDIAIFIFAVICAFVITYKLTISCGIQDYKNILYVVIFIIFICFIVFTFRPPSIALFATP